MAKTRRDERRLFLRVTLASAAVHAVVLIVFGLQSPGVYVLPAQEPEAIDVEMFRKPQEPPPEPEPAPQPAPQEYALRPAQQPQAEPAPQPPIPTPPVPTPPVATPTPPTPMPPQPVPAPPAPERVIRADALPAPSTLQRETPLRAAPTITPKVSSRSLPTLNPPTPEPPAPSPAPPTPAPPQPIAAPPSPPTPSPPAPKARKKDEEEAAAARAAGVAPLAAPSSPAPAPAGGSAGGGQNGGTADFTVRGATGPGGGLRDALRGSSLACANGKAVALNKDERTRCLDRDLRPTEGLSPLTGINPGKLKTFDARASQKDAARKAWEDVGKQPGIWNSHIGKELPMDRPMPTKTNPSGKQPDSP